MACRWLLIKASWTEINILNADAGEDANSCEHAGDLYAVTVSWFYMLTKRVCGCINWKCSNATRDGSYWYSGFIVRCSATCQYYFLPSRCTFYNFFVKNLRLPMETLQNSFCEQSKLNHQQAAWLCCSAWSCWFGNPMHCCTYRRSSYQHCN